MISNRARAAAAASAALASTDPAMTDPAIILFAHGARDPGWAEPFRKIKRALEARRPGVTVELAFLELMEPGLPDAVPKILDALRAEHPGVKIELLPAIGDVDAILEAIAGWLVGATAR